MAENESTPTVVEQPQVEPQAAAEEPQGQPEIDYEAEFKAAVESMERAEHNRQGYEARKGKTEESGALPNQATIDAMVAEAVQKAVPQLQSALAQDTIESVLNEFSGGDEAKKKLIRFHFENSVGSNGTIRERIENASLIADKKSIQKTQKELAVALHNRQGLSATGMGVSTEGQQVPDSFFSKEQLQELKSKGWNDEKIQKLKENMRRHN